MWSWKWWLLNRVLVRVGTVALVAILGWAIWDYLAPRKPEVSPLRRELAAQLIPTLVSDLRDARGSIRSVALLHLENDPTDYLTNELRAALEPSGIFDLQDRGIGEKVRDGLRLRHPSYGDREKALAAGRSDGVQGVIFGTIRTFESYQGGAKLDLDLRLADVASGELVMDRAYSREIPAGSFSAAHIAEEVGRYSWFQRFLAWAVIVLLLPVFTINFIRAMVRKESNRSNAFTLGVYTLTDALLAYILLGASLASWLSAILFLVAVGVAFAYNVAVMSFALKLET